MNRNIRALVVDDNEINLIVAEQLLISLGIGVHTAVGGEEALGLIEENDYDIVFMDKSMPGMDGVEATARIRALGINIPIIAFTAEETQDVSEWFLQSDMDDYIKKPIDITMISQVIERWFSGEAVFSSENYVFASEQINSPRQNDNVMDELSQRCGIQALDALTRMGVPVSSYFQVLQTLHRKLPEMMDGLEESVKSRDLEMYRIKVHACKSALANVGAIWQSELAQGLESATERLDKSFIKHKNPPFMKALNDLYKRLDEAKDLFQEKSEVSLKNGDIQKLRDKLCALEELLNSFDNDGASIIINELASYKYTAQIDELISETKNYISDFDHDSALERVQKIVRLQ